MIGFSGLLVNTTLSYLDVSSFTYKIHLSILPAGSFASSDGLSRLTVPISLFVNGRIATLPINQPTFPQDLTLTFKSGSVNNYPLDSFEDNVQIFAQSVINGTPYVTRNAPTHNFRVYVPLGFKYSAYLQSWSISGNVREANDVVNLAIVVGRSGTTVFFSGMAYQNLRR